MAIQSEEASDAQRAGEGSAAAILRLLGAVALEGPEPLRFLAQRRYRLLAYLALRGGWVQRDHLANLFWPDRTQDAARSNLRKLLLEVRALNLPQLESDRNGVRWDVATDVDAFKAALERGDPQTAMALYLGPALEGLEGGDSEAFGAWLEAERHRLHALWREAVVAALPQRRPAEVLELVERLLQADAFDEDAVVAALGAHRALGDVAGAARAFRCYGERLMEELGVEPSARVRAAAAQAIGTIAPPATQSSPAIGPQTSAPVPTLSGESFIGRARELEELVALLRRPECRILTITGPGGMGKSRLVKEALRGLAAAYADGVLWIALDDLADVAQVAPRIAAELSLQLPPRQDPVECVAARLATRHALLVLDNAEHLARLATLVERLVGAAPRLQVLATSRTRIGTPHECLLPLNGLTLPPLAGSVHAAAAADAVQLFVAQARAARPRFDVDANTQRIAQLVRAVAGLPLAILLAASWVRLLPMDELVKEVTQSLDVLEASDDGEERPEHRSVRATFEQSWRLLAPAEQRALAALSVMAGSFPRSMAKEVAEAPLPLLAALVDKSLLQVDERGRFSLHPLIQQFAAEKLALDPAAADLMRDRHAEGVTRFMVEYKNFGSIDQTAALRAIALELTNLLAAWNWSISRPRIDILGRCAAGLSNHFQARGPMAAGAEAFARAQATLDVHAASIPASARDATWGIPLERAALNYWLGEYHVVEAAARKALACARAVENSFGIRTSLNTLAMALMRKGRLADAALCQEEALARATSDKVPWEIAAYAGNLVSIKRELGDDEAALRLAHEALDGHRANGHRIGEVSMTNEIGQLLHGLGTFGEAIEWFDRGLRLIGGEDANNLRRVDLMTHKAMVFLDAGDPDRAEQACREALKITLEGGLHAQEPTCRRTLAGVEMAKGRSAEARLQLRAAIVATRRIDTPASISPLLRECAAYLEQMKDVATALRCVVCADTHRVSKRRLAERYRQQRDRLCHALDPAASALAEAQGAALTLEGGLALAESSLDR